MMVGSLEEIVMKRETVNAYVTHLTPWLITKASASLGVALLYAVFTLLYRLSDI